MNKWLYLKANDVYNNQRVLIAFEEDEINFSSWSNNSCFWEISIFCKAIKDWTSDIKRWSDLKEIEIINKKEFDSIKDWKTIYKRKKLSDWI